MKPAGLVAVDEIPMVAPRRGAWVETWPSRQEDQTDRVAPRRGAWVETLHAWLD